MTQSDFVRALRTVRDLFEWKLVPDNNRSPELRGEHRLHIRAISKQVLGLLDPIGAVCFATKGVLCGAHSWPAAAATLNLTETDAWRIVAASNDLTWRQVEGVRSPQSQLQALRVILLDAVGLASEADASIAPLLSSFLD